MASVMVAFEVGVDKEDASTRLNNALNSHNGQQPLGIDTRYISTIDPDTIPILSFAVVATGSDDIVDTQIQLRAIGLDIINTLKTIPQTTLRYHQ